MYRQDYDGHYELFVPGDPSAADGYAVDTNTSRPSGTFKVIPGGTTPNGHYVTWMDMLYPYLKSTQIFVGPSATSDATAPSYGYNSAFSGLTYDRYEFTSVSTPGSMSDSAVQHPSESLRSDGLHGLQLQVFRACRSSRYEFCIELQSVSGHAASGWAKSCLRRWIREVDTGSQGLSSIRNQSCCLRC